MSERVEKAKVHLQVAGASQHAERPLMLPRSQTSLSTPQVSKGILPPTTVPLCCACVFVMCVHLGVYSSVWITALKLCYHSPSLTDFNFQAY